MTLEKYRNSNDYIESLKKFNILVLSHPKSSGCALFLNLEDIKKYIKSRESDWLHKRIDPDLFQVDIADIQDKELFKVFQENFAEHLI